MTMKINRTLLIDDDEPTNFYNEHIINQSGLVNEVMALQSGGSALEYLTTEVDGEYPKPDLIFVDINMPAMNGWEFLDEYEKLDPKHKGTVIVMMLTTSLNPDDEGKAKNFGSIKGFKRKPLNQNTLQDIIEHHFS
ncbi:MAG: CheY-like chemotaxis protein [Luteibaculaceae bacterium]|jgi:CheY-like chemotaxis protein